MHECLAVSCTPIDVFWWQNLPDDDPAGVKHTDVATSSWWFVQYVSLRNAQQTKATDYF